MLAYASRTGSRRNLAALKRYGWRLLVSARGCLRHEGFPYALDNGAWTAHQREEPFDVNAFELAHAKMGTDADWTVIPDIVGGGLESLAFSLSWIDRVTDVGQALLAVQDGMSVADVERYLSPGQVGIFVGGSTEWKLATIPQWCELGRQKNCLVHVGRVNTYRRIALCDAHGASSFDGTSATKYSSTLPLLDNARRQLSFGMLAR